MLGKAQSSSVESTMVETGLNHLSSLNPRGIIDKFKDLRFYPSVSDFFFPSIAKGR